jgi:hypothetical protein
VTKLIAAVFRKSRIESAENESNIKRKSYTGKEEIQKKEKVTTEINKQNDFNSWI